MRKRDCRLTLYLTADEMAKLNRKSKAACVDNNRYLRAFINGEELRPAPDERFWQAMEIVREFADKIDALAMKVDDKADVIAIMAEAKKWRMLENAIEKEFLRPKKVGDS